MIKTTLRLLAFGAVYLVQFATGSFASAQTVIVARDALSLLGQPIEVGNGVWKFGGAPTLEMIRTAYNVNAADTTNADQLRTGGGLGLNLNGAGVVVGIWDGGAVRPTHQELIGRVTVVDSVAYNFHSTHVAGTIGASGVNPAALGMAPAVTIRSRDFNNDTAEMATDAALINVSNHSYGAIRGWTTAINWGVGAVNTWFADRSFAAVEDPDFGKYDATAQAVDDVLHSNPRLLSVWSAGNDRGEAYTNAHGDNKYVSYFSANTFVGWSGPGWYIVPTAMASAPPSDGNGGTGFDSLPQSQVAKNTLTVGSILDITADPYTNANVTLNSFSSFGPTDDGRIKPDVVGNGNAVTSTFETSDTVYGTLSGTSMAAPNVTGSLALVLQHYRNLNGNTDPRSATLKALAIHTAFDAGNTGPDYSTGWGVLDVAAAANLLTNAELANPTDFVLERSYSAAENTFLVHSNGLSSFKATLVWTDPAPLLLPGESLDDNQLALVNDLDLWITGPGGTYFAWNLNPANPNAPAFRTTFNHRDNVEQVLLDLPLVGDYVIHISGGSFSQDYSLIYSGVVAVPEPSSLALLGCASVGLGCWARRRRSGVSRKVAT